MQLNQRLAGPITNKTPQQRLPAACRHIRPADPSHLPSQAFPYFRPLTSPCATGRLRAPAVLRATCHLEQREGDELVADKRARFSVELSEQAAVVFSTEL